MTEAELKAAFEERKPALTALGQWVKAYVTETLEKELGSVSAAEKFFQLPPKPRVKETDSFLEKALVRKPKDDPMKEITDQVGVRFVVLLLEDIDRVGKIIKAGPWAYQKDRDHEQERLEKPDYFAYQSDHYVVTTAEPHIHGGVTIPAGLSCEVQVRTILQHAYAEMAHKSDYKPSIRLPGEDKKHVKRALAKGSALIETTDDVFRDIEKRLRDYDRSIQALLVRSAELYEKLTGEKGAPDSALAHVITDAYREFLAKMTPSDLNAWVSDKNGLEDTLKEKRVESVFYRDPVVVLLGSLINKHRTALPTKWPVDMGYLERYYLDLGISTDGLF
ncbi:MAG: RelA/SpoT domain-containing protein [Flavobacteriales bacterium]|nr:RelA/SpoT domain-containing protein [Flavobacteriales bacterium]